MHVQSLPSISACQLNLETLALGHWAQHTGERAFVFSKKHFLLPYLNVNLNISVLR